MPRKIDRRHGSGKIMIDGKAAIDPRTRGSRDPRKGNKYKYRMSGDPERSVNTQYEGKPTGEPGVRQIGRNTFKASASLIKPDLMAGRKAAEDAKPFKTGGMCRGAGAAVKGTKFEGVF